MRVVRGIWSARFDPDELLGMIDDDRWRSFSGAQRAYVVDLLGTAARSDPLLRERLEAARDADDSAAFGALLADAVSRRLNAKGN